MEKLTRASLPAVRSIATSLLIGTAASLAIFFSILIDTDGTFPRDVCEFLPGADGLLPLNPNSGGSVDYSCNPNIAVSAFYIGLPAIFLALVFHLLRRVLANSISFVRVFAGKR